MSTLRSKQLLRSLPKVQILSGGVRTEIILCTRVVVPSRVSESDRLEAGTVSGFAPSSFRFAKGECLLFSPDGTGAATLEASWTTTPKI